MRSPSFFLKKVIAFLAITFAGFFVAEISVLGMQRLGVFHSHTLDELFTLVNSIGTAPGDPIFIPHPYFGYVYKPSSKIVENNHVMHTNSEGYVDREFPKDRQKNLFVIGLFGGSAAMSWGVENPEHRLSSYLERRLNRFSEEKKLGKLFRVLNLGVGGQMAYQSAQMFSYYVDRLDGAILYNGNNELSWGMLLATPYPIRYPQMDLYGILMDWDYAYHRVNLLRRRCAAIEKILKKIPLASRLQLVRSFSALYLQKIQTEVSELNQGIDKKRSRGAAWIVSDPQRNNMPAFDNYRYHFSTKPEDLSYRLKIFKHVLPIVNLNPIESMMTFAKSKGIKYAWVIQPLLGSVNKSLTAREMDMTLALPAALKDFKNASNVQYQKDGIPLLLEQANLLQRKGLLFLNLNTAGQFNSLNGKDMFLDNVHLLPPGNEIVSEKIFSFLIQNWNLDSPNEPSKN